MLVVLRFISDTDLAQATGLCHSNFLVSRSYLILVWLCNRRSSGLAVVNDPKSWHLLTDTDAFLVELTLVNVDVCHRITLGQSITSIARYTIYRMVMRELPVDALERGSRPVFGSLRRLVTASWVWKFLSICFLRVNIIVLQKRGGHLFTHDSRARRLWGS